MEKVKIIFNDGTELMCDRNGDCYIVDEKPAFPRDLTEVSVEGTNDSKHFHYAELVECASVDGKYWFTFVETPEETRNIRQMMANIEYIAMMADIDLEEE